MSVPRSAATLLVVLALFGPAGPAAAARFRLTPAPPAGFSPATPPAPPDSSASQSSPARSDLPHTGTDIPRELLLAGLLLGAGVMLRRRRTPDRD